MTTLSRVGDIVRQHDPDRFFTTLFAPAATRETLWALYAFNHELARTREIVREPMMAMIRLQWWREVVEGARRRHEVAEPLGAALDAGALRPADLLEIIEGREAEPDGTWIETVAATAGALATAAGHALGTTGSEAIAAAGSAYGAAGVLRNRAVAAAAGAGHRRTELAATGPRRPDPPRGPRRRPARRVRRPRPAPDHPGDPARPWRQARGGVGRRARAALTYSAATACCAVTRAAQNLNSGILPNGSSAGLVRRLAAASA